MNKKLLLAGAIIAGIVFIAGGVFLGQANAQDSWPGSMMGRFGSNAPSAYGMMGGGMMHEQYGGMMPGFGSQVDVEPLTIEEAQTAVSNYLDGLNDNELVLGEIMIFDNHAYAQVLNSETGLGAFELLVDPVTGNVFPEPGPNMMWNTEYGMMSGESGGMMNGQHGGMMNGQYGGMMNGQYGGMMNGQHGGMMNGQYGGMMSGQYGGMMNGAFGHMMDDFGIDPDEEISVTEEDAVSLAQEYLDANLPGTNADDHADSFPGYYTVHIERDGRVIGMLSVNGYNGQVFLHHWHGEFIEMAGEGHS